MASTQQYGYFSRFGHRLGGWKRERQLFQYYIMTATIVSFPIVFWLDGKDWSAQTKLFIAGAPLWSVILFIGGVTLLYRPLKYSAPVALFAVMIATWLAIFAAWML